MSAARVVGLLMAGALIALGALWSFAGMGYVGTGETSQTASMGGALIAGLGVALGFVVLQRRR